MTAKHTETQKEDEPLATFTYKLVSSTGYEAQGQYLKVTPDQFGQVVAALNGTLTNVSPVDDLVKALQNIVDSTALLESTRYDPLRDAAIAALAKAKGETK